MNETQEATNAKTDVAGSKKIREMQIGCLGDRSDTWASRPPLTKKGFAGL
jgi:hypothetical protein